MLAVPFLVVFITGLGVAVYSMLQGLAPAPGAGPLTRLLMKTAPSTAAFAVLFGAIGYLCTTHTSLTPWVVLLIATAGAAGSLTVSAPILVRLIARMRAEPSGALEIEGQFAVVLSPVSDSAPGEIQFERDGRQFHHPALNLVPGELQPGQEVVIDRIEAGVAYVEDWGSVERRL
jgi:hypothetical protein